MTVGVAGPVFQVIDQAPQLLQAGQGARTDHAGQAVAEQRLKQAELVLLGKGAQVLQGLMADAAFGGGGHAHEGGVIVVVGDQSQPSAQIANLCPIKKTLSSGDLVGDLRFAQGLLQHPGLVVGAVQHRKVVPLRPHLCALSSPQRLNPGHDPLRLVLLVVTIDDAHRLPFPQFREQGFGIQLGVGLDDVVGGAQDGCRGAVVLLQLDHLELRKVLRQAAQIVQGGATPAVDRLIVIAHRGQAGI